MAPGQAVWPLYVVYRTRRPSLALNVMKASRYSMACKMKSCYRCICRAGMDSPTCMLLLVPSFPKAISTTKKILEQTGESSGLGIRSFIRPIAPILSLTSRFFPRPADQHHHPNTLRLSFYDHRHPTPCQLIILPSRSLVCTLFNYTGALLCHTPTSFPRPHLLTRPIHNTLFSPTPTIFRCSDLLHTAPTPTLMVET